MTLYPDKMYITQVTDAQEGLELLEGVKDAVNAVWEKREELIAVMKPKAAPRHLDIWALLPQEVKGLAMLAELGEQIYGKTSEVGETSEVYERAHG